MVDSVVLFLTIRFCFLRVCVHGQYYFSLVIFSVLILRLVFLPVLGRFWHVLRAMEGRTLSTFFIVIAIVNCGWCVNIKGA